MRSALVAYLIEQGRRPFAWGESDCLLFLADWVREAYGVDPAADLRGTYSTEAEGLAIMAAGGGKLRLVARRMRRVGAVRTDIPAPGDIAVLRLAGAHWAAIRTPDGKWANRSEGGLLVFSSDRVAAAWSVAPLINPRRRT